MSEAKDATAASRASKLFTNDSRYLDRFGLLLVLTITSIVFLSLVELAPPKLSWAGSVASVAATTIVLVSLLLATRAAGLNPRAQRVLDIVLAVGWLALVVLLAVLNLSHTTDVASYRFAPGVAVVVLSAVTPIAVVRRLIQHRQITVQTVIGGISVYLMIGVAYFYVYLALDKYLTVPIFGAKESTTSFMYFSLSTLTTVGYGDLSAHTRLGHLAASSEAVIGQLYLVTFMAMLVGLLAQNWRPRSPDAN